MKRLMKTTHLQAALRAGPTLEVTISLKAHGSFLLPPLFLGKELVSLVWYIEDLQRKFEANNFVDIRGRLTLDRATSKPKLLCRNYECGVLIPVNDSSEVKDATIDEVFRGVVPVPMKLPAPAFEGSHETPWFYLG